MFQGDISDSYRMYTLQTALKWNERSGGAGRGQPLPHARCWRTRPSSHLFFSRTETRSRSCLFVGCEPEIWSRTLSELDSRSPRPEG